MIYVDDVMRGDGMSDVMVGVGYTSTDVDVMDMSCALLLSLSVMEDGKDVNDWRDMSSVHITLVFEMYVVVVIISFT